MFLNENLSFDRLELPALAIPVAKRAANQRCCAIIALAALLTLAASPSVLADDKLPTGYERWVLPETKDVSGSSVPQDGRRITGGRSPQHGVNVTVPALLIQGVVHVLGDQHSEKVWLTIANDAVGKNEQFVVSYSYLQPNGHYSSTVSLGFPLDAVEHAFVMLGDGNDTFVNLTIVDCTVYGEQGNDVLVGGFSSDAIYGGSGGDVLFGNHGADYLWGGPQSDVLCGGHPFGSEDAVSLFETSTMTFRYDLLDVEWVHTGGHADWAVDLLHGGPEDPEVDADWFLLEVVEFSSGVVSETDVAVDFVPDFDWFTINDHFWE